jgi:hypothetical protein
MNHLLAQLADAETELRRLGVLRSRNIVGDLAEHVACERLGLVRASASQRGDRYEVRDVIEMQLKDVFARAIYRPHVRGWTMTLSAADTP